MTSVRRRDSGLSPTIGVVLLLAIMVLTTTMAAAFVFNFAPEKGEEEVTGVSVTFTEDDYGGVEVRLVERGTADSVEVHTPKNEYSLGEPGDTQWVAPGEGDITIITESNGHRVVLQTYSPRNAPDEELLAHAGPDQQQAPGSVYTFDGSNSVGDIVEYRWDFDGDGQTDATGETVSHSFTDPGVYEVKLTVESSSGATHANTTTVQNAHLVVAKDGSGDHESIQAAVDDASVGWSILVENARYEESVTVDIADVTLLSSTAPTIDGLHTETTPALDITSSGVTVRGLRVTRFNESAGIRVGASDVILDDVYVSQSGVDEMTGAVTATFTASNLQIQNSRIAANEGCGITLGDNSDLLGGPSDTTLTNTVVHSSESFGVCALSTSQRLSVTESRINNNDAGGLLLYGTNETTVSQSELRNNGKTQSNGVGAFHAYNTRSIHVTQSNISGNLNQALTFNDVTDVTIEETQFNSNEQAAIMFRGKEENNELSSKFSGLGISIQGVSDVQVRNSSIDNNRRHGVYLNSTDDVLFANSTFLYNGNTSDTSTQGIYMRSKGSHTVENTSVVHSQIYGSGLEDIYVESKSTNADAPENWWGQDTGPETSQYGGSVDVDPYCTVEDCSDQK